MSDRHESEARVHRSCVACGSVRLTKLRGYESVHLVRCVRCGLTFSGRKPSVAELDAHYRGYGDWPDSTLTRMRYREVLQRAEQHRATGRVFDLGCGAGYFLEEAAKAGWQPYGSTVGELSIELCRSKGLNVVSAEAASDYFPTGYFDAATAFEVVEHLVDPAVEARLLSKVVRPGGVFYCTTPNFNSLTRHLLASDWRVISYPEHLVYFTARTLESWLGPFGFRLQKLETTGISPGELRRAIRQRVARTGGDRRVAANPGGAGAVRDIDERVRDAMESGYLLPAAKRLLNDALTRAKLGDTLRAWFVRMPSE